MDLLSIKQNEKLLEKYRYFNVEHIDWWDSTYDCFKEELKEKGIYVSRMYFSGFWSQGDGACFEGHLDDAQTFLDTNFKPDEYPTIRKLLHAGGSVKFSSEHSGHYYHENCTRFHIEVDRFEYVVDASTDFHQQVAESLGIAGSEAYTSTQLTSGGEASDFNISIGNTNPIPYGFNSDVSVKGSFAGTINPSTPQAKSVSGVPFTLKIKDS